MTKEELRKLSRENLKKSKQGSLCECYDEAFIKGYELSEKRIAELEKENKVLAQNLEDTEILNKTYEKRFKDLEKENAELKETLRTYNGCGDWDNDFHTCRVYLQHEELQMYIHQLTTAKEIIREYINIIKGDTKNWKKTQEKAEQFLNSEVEK